MWYVPAIFLTHNSVLLCHWNMTNERQGQVTENIKTEGKEKTK